jgi:hypothetical protein
VAIKNPILKKTQWNLWNFGKESAYVADVSWQHNVALTPI